MKLWLLSKHIKRQFPVSRACSSTDGTKKGTKHYHQFCRCARGAQENEEFYPITQCMCLHEDRQDVRAVIVLHLNHRAIFPRQLNIFFSPRPVGQPAEPVAAAHPWRPLTHGAAASSSSASWPREATVPLGLGPVRSHLQPSFASPHTLLTRENSRPERL